MKSSELIQQKKKSFINIIKKGFGTYAILTNKRVQEIEITN